MTDRADGDFPGYRILSELEPLGDVRRFAALDVRLERRVEIHQLSAREATAERAAEFRRRVSRLARLNHPGIAPVHRIEDGAPGRLYCVVPHLLDDSLAARLAAGPIPYRDAVRLANDLAPALAAAHAAGVVGGELDPSTIACVDGRWVATALGIARSAPGSRLVAPEEHGGGVPGPASDIFVAGLVLRDAFGPGSRRIAPVLARAISADPAERWPNAVAFRVATRRATRPRRWKTPVLTTAGLAVAYLIAAWRFGLWPLRHPTTVVYQVAVVPFVAGIGEPGSDAQDLARIIQFDLEGLPGLRVASGWVPKVLGTDSAGDAIAPEVVTPALVRRLRTEWVVHGRVDRQGPSLRVAVTLYDRDATAKPLPDEVRGAVDQIPSLGDSLARRVLALVAKSQVARYVPRPELQGVPFPALKSFLRGEESFGRDALARAQEFYTDALRADPSFALAEWRLANVQRWRRLPVAPDLPALYRRAGDRLGPTDRRLLEALIEPDLKRRFALLDSAVAADPDDAYARFVYAEELWHRGPLIGLDISEALDRMKSAVAADSALSRAYDHIIMYYIREGDAREAWKTFEEKARVAFEPSADDLDTRKFLRLALYERFHPWRAAGAHALLRWRHDPGEAAALGRVARLATPWMDIPVAQVTLGRILLAIGPAVDSAGGSARVGIALGLMAQGQVRAGLAELDSGAAALGTDEMRLQRAEWRLIPPALGLRGWGEASPDTDRAWLERRAGDPVLGARVRWSLALGRLGAGDTAGFVRYVDSLPPPVEPLGVLLRAIRAGVRDEHEVALALADSTRQAINVTTPPDPFAPAALHLFAGDWNRAVHAEAVDQDWQWYLAAEFEGWPSGAPQAGEVDGVMGMLARRKRAELGLTTGVGPTDTAEACRMMRRLAELWRGADSGLAWVASLSGLKPSCRP